MNGRALFNETFARCMPQATKPFVSKFLKVTERKSFIEADIVLWDGGLATFEINKPDVAGCFGFYCSKNDGLPFIWENGHWQRTDLIRRQVAA